MGKNPCTRVALLTAALLSLSGPALANVHDIYVSAANDVVNYRDWGYGGSYRGSIVDANPNLVSHTWSPGYGVAYSSSLTFLLDSVAALPVASITAASFNFKVIDVWTSGRDDIGSFNGGGTVFASGGVGWKSFDITDGLKASLGSSAASLTYVLDYTGYSGFTFASAEGGAPAYLRITTAVPEPESYAMLLAGLGLLATVARRRMR